MSDHVPPVIRLGIVPAILWMAASQGMGNVVFPPDAGVIDVTRPPYSADPTGATDSTQALQRALSDHPSGNRIIYLPNGTYLISDTLRWPEGDGDASFMKRTILQGQSREGTILRLKDHADGFGTGGQTEARYNRPDGKPMIFTGTAPAQRFRNALRDLTLDTGHGNPGAIGARFMTNNQGGVFNVTIRSGDGSGRIGLDLGYESEIGPLLVKGLKVEGFDIGVHSWGSVNSITMVDVEVVGQKQAGILNVQQVLSIENLRSRNDVPALRDADPWGVVTLIGADLRTLSAESEASAVDVEGTLYARDVHVWGYETAIQTPRMSHPGGNGVHVRELVGGQTLSLFDDEPRGALMLPIKPAPLPPEDPMDRWVSPLAFGGAPNDGQDDTAAIQQAIDSGATTVYLPNGTWNVSGELFIRGQVRRFIGCEARLTGDARIIIDDGDWPVVWIERLETLPIHEPTAHFVHRSGRTVVMSNLRLSRQRAYQAEEGAGDVFIEDVAGDPWHFVAGQNVWARQLNPENSRAMIVNRGARLWILGLKTEGDGPALHAIGGRTEIVGAFIYANTRRPKNDLFILEQRAAFSVTMGESSFRHQPFERLVVESRDGQMRVLSRQGLPQRGQGSVIPLFVTSGGQNVERKN